MALFAKSDYKIKNDEFAKKHKQDLLLDFAQLL